MSESRLLATICLRKLEFFGHEAASVMNWLLELLGYRGREYREDDFSVRIEPIFREVVSVIYTRQGKGLQLGGERIGKKWEGIEVQLPPTLEGAQVAQVVRDLETAFVRLRYGYVIARKTGVDTVPEPERQGALAELREMGYEIEILQDGKIRQTKRAGAPRQDVETLRKQAPRINSLIQSLRGTRQRLETLAKSKEF